MKLTARRGGSDYLVDCTIDDDTMRAARRALSRGDAGPAEAALSTTREPNARALLIESLGDWSGPAPFLERWASGSSSPGAAAALAIQATKWAWRARGGGAAKYVRDAAANEFAVRLARARDLLLKAAKADPKDASMIPHLIWCSRGLGDDELGRKAESEGLRRAPSLRAVYSSMLLSHTPRWGGSDEQSVEYARNVANTAPPESGAAVLLVEARYYESEFMLSISVQGKAFWKRPEVRSDILTADEKCREGGLAGMNGIRNRHWLAYGLWRLGETRLARPHFEAIGNARNERPWAGLRRGFNWLFSPFGKARRVCLKA